jgi:DNA polymerase-3 subunit epsilon
MYIFFDTETTGLPRNWKAPVTDVENWPRLVQLAYLLFDEKGRKLQAGNYIIRPEGFQIPSDASAVHGITTERAVREGIPIHTALLAFMDQVKSAQYLVAHNMAFDEKILGAELLRLRYPLIQGPQKICTMESTVAFCALPGKFGYKWPKLSELHQKLFGTTFEEAHNAAVDIEATAKCFWELRRMGVI